MSLVKFLPFVLLLVRDVNNAATSYGLYSSRDDVIVLTVGNFKKEVMDSPKGWLVEFYNSWCGFCQRFAPSWKALATNIKGWRDLVAVAAIDCSVDENTPLCREYEIMGYPTLRYFHEGYEPGPKNLGLTVPKGDSEMTHRHALIQTLIEEQKEGRGRMYPPLQAYDSAFLTNLLQGKEFGFLIVESLGTFLGAEVTMDFHKTSNIMIRYSHDSNTDLVKRYGLEKFPVVISVDKDNKHQVYYVKEATREAIKIVLTNVLTSKQIKITDETPSSKEIFTGKWVEAQVSDMSAMIQERTRQALKDRVKTMGDVVFQMDMETALRYSLIHEISATHLIEGEKLTVLRDYLELLSKYFPFGRGGKLFLADLKAFVNDASSIDGSVLAEFIVKAEKDFGPVYSSPQQWLACSGSTLSFRGYPCGLWKLFHYLTVNSANSNYGHPLEVLDVMHGYIKNYFGCRDCSEHFQDMAQKRHMKEVSSRERAVLWLWEAHNEVNKRLSGDQTEDPDFPKIQFPSAQRCPQCRGRDGDWDLTEVSHYLKNMYSSINVKYIGSDTSVLHLGLEADGVSSGSASIFKGMDISMCFILYVCSFVLLALLIRIFLRRGYRKKPYVHDLLGKV